MAKVRRWADVAAFKVAGNLDAGDEEEAEHSAVNQQAVSSNHVWGAEPLSTNSHSFRLTPWHPAICGKWPILRENGLSPRLPREFADQPGSLRAAIWRASLRVSDKAARLVL